MVVRSLFFYYGLTRYLLLAHRSSAGVNCSWPLARHFTSKDRQLEGKFTLL